MSKAIVLLSGGLDSTTILYLAKKKYKPYCLIFDYGQRHDKEVDIARSIARHAKCAYKIVKIALPWQGSSLLDKAKNLPRRRKVNPKEIPSTYVPGRNIIFLSFAVSFAEAIGAKAIYIGANAIDYSGYPDCRPKFFDAYRKAIKLGTKVGVQKANIKILTPLIHKTKAQIIRQGMKLKVPYQKSWSCYQGGKKPCGQCDSCLLRQKGFERAGFLDPALSS